MKRAMASLDGVIATALDKADKRIAKATVVAQATIYDASGMTRGYYDVMRGLPGALRRLRDPQRRVDHVAANLAAAARRKNNPTHYERLVDQIIATFGSWEKFQDIYNRRAPRSTDAFKVHLYEGTLALYGVPYGVGQ